MNRKHSLEDPAIFLLILIGLKNLLTALPLKATQIFARYFDALIDPRALMLHHGLSFCLGVLMLLLARRLYQRVRLAWAVETAALSLTVIIQLWRYHEFTVPIVAAELFVLIVLWAFRKEFTRRSDPLTVRTALGFVAASAALLLLNATVGIYLMRGSLRSIHDLGDALLRSVELLVLMDTGVMGTRGRLAELYAGLLISLNWVCIVASAALLLKPLVYNPIVTRRDRERVRGLVNRYGQNPVSYLALEPDKRYFFGSAAEGVCAYAMVGDVMVVCGDPICAPEDGPALLSELTDYCKKNAFQLLFVNVTDCFRELYRKRGFGMAKVGEDACFHLADYTLAGGRAAKVRAAVNHAAKAGIAVFEYRPAEDRDPELEREIGEITAEWLKRKGGYEIQFMLGGTGLPDPMERRYFCARDPVGTLLGFVVFLPYRGGYMADVTRRRSGAPQGVLESIICRAWAVFRDEGVEWGNMGLSPLYNVAASDKATMTEKLFTYVYENLNSGYGFKSLHHAKAKYGPTHWQPRYMACWPRSFTPAMAYAMVRCQIKTGFWQVVKETLFPGRGAGKNRRAAPV